MSRNHHYPSFEEIVSGRYPHVPTELYDQPIFPGNGYPPNPGEDRPGGSPWGRLAKGCAMGKSSVLYYNADTQAVQPAAVPMLQIEGDDLDACQLCVTLAPPRVIAQPFSSLQGASLQVLTGEQDNAEVSSLSFPGTGAPIAWPPLEAIVEFGIKGASAKFVVDYVNGVSFNVVASYLRVYAAISQSEVSGDIRGTSAAYYLAAFVGPGWAKTGTAQRTVYIGNVAVGAESEVYDIPKFAKRVYVIGCDNNAVPSVVAGFFRGWQSPDGSAGTTSTECVFINSNQPQGFQLSNGTQYFSFYNQGSADAKFAVVFELAV